VVVEAVVIVVLCVAKNSSNNAKEFYRSQKNFTVIFKDTWEGLKIFRPRAKETAQRNSYIICIS
jgi:hypothetical protein